MKARKPGVGGPRPRDWLLATRHRCPRPPGPRPAAHWEHCTVTRGWLSGAGRCRRCTWSRSQRACRSFAPTVSDLPCNVRREGGQSLVIGGSSLVILEERRVIPCNPSLRRLRELLLPERASHGRAPVRLHARWAQAAPLSSRPSVGLESIPIHARRSLSP